MENNTSRLSLQSIRVENKSCLRKACYRFFHLFSLNGHLSYAFIYGSWEIIRARKVGTTHTKVDYVVYRLFYPVILIGACLFAVVAESDLAKFFSLIEVWAMILHISYSFIFLQNVLVNNLHRDNVRHRQKIPERLVVTDEIEKGGHKFYICKRYSILPTEKLYYSERFIWLMFNVLASLNVSIMLGHFTGQIRIDSSGSPNVNKDLEDIRAYSMGLLILADVFLTPIPLRFAHVIFPVMFFLLYRGFLILIFTYSGKILYFSFNLNSSTTEELYLQTAFKAGVIVTVHLILTGFVALRDYLISLLDDSRTPKQLQSLRSQKRLARRKLMNYVEGPDGRIIGISLEKHNYVPGLDEYIKTAKAHKRKSVVPELNTGDGQDELEDDGLDEIKMFRKDGGGDEIVSASVQVEKDNEINFLPGDSVPITAAPKPPPMPRYTTPVPEDERFSSSSSTSEEDEWEAIKKSVKRLPTPPKDTDYDSLKDDKYKRPSHIPVPLHKLGILVKPRDSKENIHQKMDNLDDSPPTPPFVKLVQALVKANKEAKGEIEMQRRMKELYEAEDGNAIQTKSGAALVKVIRTNKALEDKRMMRIREDSQPRLSDGRAHVRRRRRRKDGKKRDDVIDKLISDAVKPSHLPERMESELKAGKKVESDGASKMSHATLDTGKPVASRVIHVKTLDLRKNMDQKNDGDANVSDFHRELAEKLLRERNKMQGIPEVRKEGSKKKLRRSAKKKRKKLKGILKHDDFGGGGGGGERLPSARLKRREERLLKRRDERALMGKHGQPTYDPLAVPENVGVAEMPGRTSTSTTFHYLGTKLKGEKGEKTTIPKEDLPLYRRHPGIGTLDDGEIEYGRPSELEGRSLVAFHPLVKYFDVNEVEPQEELKTVRKPRQSRWAK